MPSDDVIINRMQIDQTRYGFWNGIPDMDTCIMHTMEVSTRIINLAYNRLTYNAHAVT